MPEQERKINMDHVSDKDKQLLKDPEEPKEETVEETVEEQSADEPQAKKQRFQNKKKLKGQNKSRGPTFQVNKLEQLCDFLVQVQEGEELPECPRKQCPYGHDIEAYLKSKPADIGPNCYNFEQSGKCTRGLACRFAQSHLTPTGRNLVDQKKYEEYESKAPYVMNQLDKEVQFALRKRTYDFNLAEKLIDTYDNSKKNMTPDEVSYIKIFNFI